MRSVEVVGRTTADVEHGSKVSCIFRLFFSAKMFLLSTKDDTVTKNTVTKNTVTKNTVTKNTVAKNTVAKNTVTKNNEIIYFAFLSGGFGVYPDLCAL